MIPIFLQILYFVNTLFTLHATSLIFVFLSVYPSSTIPERDFSFLRDLADDLASMRDSAAVFARSLKNKNDIRVDRNIPRVSARR